MREALAQNAEVSHGSPEDGRSSRVPSVWMRRLVLSLYISSILTFVVTVLLMFQPPKELTAEDFWGMFVPGFFLATFLGSMFVILSAEGRAFWLKQGGTPGKPHDPHG